MKRFLLSLSLLLCFAAVSYAQFDMGEPVKWKSQMEEIEPGVFEVQVTAKIEEGWHTYGLGPYDGGPNPTILTVSGEGVELIGEPYVKQGGRRVMDETFGMEIDLIENGDILAQKIRVSPEALGKKLKVAVEYQACTHGSCVAPQEAEMSLGLPETAVISSPEKTKGGSLWGFILEAIAWGLVALLTPCVFPMIPMTVSFFLKQNEKNPSKGRFMAILYGICIVLIYTIPIAIIILLTYTLGGKNFAADIFNWIATSWINVIFFLIFVIFALSFFGAFEIVLPSSVVNKADSKSNRGGILGVFFMALTLVLVSFSCTGPIVGSAIIKSMQGEVMTPIVVMLVFSIVFAIPFTIFAFAPSLLKKLPKSGGWLNSVKVVLGFIELALGMKFLSVADQTYHWGILDREVYLAFWIVIAALLGMYLLGKLRFKYDSPSDHVSVGRLMLAIITFAFMVYMIPGMWGAPLKALSGYLPPIQTQDFVVPYTSGAAIGTYNPSSTTVNSVVPDRKYSDKLHLPHGLVGYFTFDEALKASKEQGKPVFFDFTGHGCVNCREMEARVWSDPKVLEMLRNDFVICSLYGDDKMDVLPEDYVTLEDGKVLKGMGKINSRFVMEKFSANAQPFYLVLDSDGNTLSGPVGYNLNVDNYVDFLQKGLDAYRELR
ncbi:MAG: thioredoxin family protein [Bacteroidales bacterium]|nr:thioredoxin family protein [Bacteroidales bacterium]MBP5518368.1 thioredoxin family protein [Bacteroidales bacterium]